MQRGNENPEPAEAWVAACALQMTQLAEEIEHSIRSIEENALPRLEQSVGRQRELSAALAAHWLRGAEAAPGRLLDQRVVAAATRLRRINRQHAVLLEHSGRFLSMLQLLYSSRGPAAPGECGWGDDKRRRWSVQG